MFLGYGTWYDNETLNKIYNFLVDYLDSDIETIKHDFEQRLYEVIRVTSYNNKMDVRLANYSTPFNRYFSVIIPEAL